MVQTKIHRTKFQIPGDISREEMQRLIREQTGRTAYLLSEQEYNKIKILDEEKRIIGALMGDRFTQLRASGTKNDIAKADELLTMTRFLFKAGLSDTHIVKELSESPDFIIEHNTERIGVELTELIDSPIQREVNDLKKTLNRAREILLRNHDGFSGTFNLTISAGSIRINEKSLQEINRRDKNALPLLVANTIYAYAADRSIAVPSFITKISFTPSVELNVELAQDYLLNQAQRSVIMQAISIKEDKLDEYRRKSSLPSYWLLLILGGAGEPDSVNLEQLNLRFTSTFDKVFLMESFTGKVLTLVG
jgi:hypothetical protein